jgi:hypothetical protein
MIDKHQIDLALQAMLGFKLGKWGADVRELASTIGLTSEEWEYIKLKEDSGGLDEFDIDIINKELNEDE